MNLSTRSPLALRLQRLMRRRVRFHRLGPPPLSWRWGQLSASRPPDARQQTWPTLRPRFRSRRRQRQRAQSLRTRSSSSRSARSGRPASRRTCSSARSRRSRSSPRRSRGLARRRPLRTGPTCSSAPPPPPAPTSALSARSACTPTRSSSSL